MYVSMYVCRSRITVIVVVITVVAVFVVIVVAVVVSFRRRVQVHTVYKVLHYTYKYRSPSALPVVEVYFRPATIRKDGVFRRHFRVRERQAIFQQHVDSRRYRLS